jgi:hypothetical protein
MLADTLTITYNTVDYDLIRTKESNYTSEYFYRSALLDFKLQIAHIIPSNNAGVGEQHGITLWAHTYDADGVEIGRESVYKRFRTDIGKQDTTTMVYLNSALSALVATIATDFANRQS